MGQIYRSATAVVVYAGPATEQTQLGLNLANRLANHLMNEPKTEFGLDQEFSNFADNKLEELGFPLSGDAAWPAIRSIIHLTWAIRAWMIQEAILNPMATIRCGIIELPLDMITTLCYLARSQKFPNLILSGQSRTEAELDRRALANILFIGIVRMALWSSIPDSPLPTMYYLLSWTLGFDCEDQRDKVYCLLGTATDASQYEIEPNYHLSVRQVYIDVTVRMLQSNTTLTFLPAPVHEGSLH